MGSYAQSDKFEFDWTVSIDRFLFCICNVIQ